MLRRVPSSVTCSDDNELKSCVSGWVCVCI